MDRYGVNDRQARIDWLRNWEMVWRVSVGGRGGAHAKAGDSAPPRGHDAVAFNGHT